jgi:hypothetical protein
MRPWRWQATLALLVLAALACRFEVSTAHFETPRLYNSPDAGDSTRSFKPDDAIYCVVALKDVKDSASVAAVWTRIEGEGPDAVETDIARTELATGSGTLTFDLQPPEEGREKGRYKITLYLDGDPKESIEFRVK